MMMAQGGPPKYNKRPATITSNLEVGRASHLITVKPDDDEAIDYHAGHVVALEIKDPQSIAEEKWLVGPYTVTRANATSFDVLYRVVGDKTEKFSALKPGSIAQFGGKFKVPILEGINPEGLDRVIGVSTGVGAGPLIGFAEEALSKLEGPSTRIDLYVGFREEDDICCRDALDALAEAHPKHFSWTPILSSVNGRSSSLYNLELLSKSVSPAPGATHYHLVGNGAMVNEWKAGLVDADVPDIRVTSEIYFNHKIPASDEVVKQIGKMIKR